MIDWYDDLLTGISGPEGAKTGQPTRIMKRNRQGQLVPASTAIGKWQILKGTRLPLYKRLGYNSPQELNEAEKKFRTDPTFEASVAREYLKDLDKRIPSTVQGEERTKRIFAGWLSGDPNTKATKVPGNNMSIPGYIGEAFKRYRTTPSGQGAPQTVTDQSTTSPQYSLTTVNSSPSWTAATTKTLPTDFTTPTDMAKKKMRPLKAGLQPDSTYLYSTSDFLGQGERKAPMTAKTSREKTDWKSAASSLAADIVPYASNLYNANMKPAQVPQPTMYKPMQLQRVSMANDRYQANAAYRSMNRSLDDTLDGNTAVAAKLANKAQTMNTVSAVNEKERLTNQGIANDETKANQAIANANLDKVDMYRQQLAERENVIKSWKSANLSNAADKFTAQQNVKGQEALERDRMRILENTDDSGTFKRLVERMAAQEKAARGEKAFGGRLYTAGRFMRTLKPIK